MFNAVDFNGITLSSASHGFGWQNWALYDQGQPNWTSLTILHVYSIIEINS